MIYMYVCFNGVFEGIYKAKSREVEIHEFHTAVTI